MTKIISKGNMLIVEKKDEIIQIEPYGQNCFRIRSTRNSRISDENWTLLPPQEANATIEMKENEAKMVNGDLSVLINGGNAWWPGNITYLRKEKPILVSRTEGDYVTNYIHKEGNNYQIKVIFDANDGEHFYGLGQEMEDAFDRKGSTCNLMHYNTKSALPVYYSSLGYGFLWNNPAPGRCETTRNHTMWVADSAYQADYLIYVGDTPAKVMNTYCDLTGYAPQFPEWAAGFWQCKLRYESQEELLAVAKEYKRRSIPIDAIVIDYFHWTEQGEWKFDHEYWPDPTSMCEELRGMGIEPVVSIWPTINPASENYHEMSEGNMLVRPENGQFGLFDFYGQQTFIDPSNPKTREFVWNKVKENYYRYGIKTFWLDEAEPEIHPQQFGNLRFYVGNGAQTAMLYPYYYCQMFYEGLQSVGEKGMVSLTRAAYPGSQKFGAIVWNGDIGSNFDALRQSVTSGLSMAMSGIPWWNSDIGGFFGGDIESDLFKELIIRWFQFGLFSPVMRLHGLRNKTKNQKDKHPGIKAESGGDNEIWSFGEENYLIIKNLIELREKMKPYITKHMEEASTKGIPLMRPMFFEYYNDEHCYSIEDQYLFGPDILFAPIVVQGQTEREVYLPEGEWVNVIDGASYKGKQIVNIHAKLDEFIAFTKKGSEITKVFQ